MNARIVYVLVHVSDSTSHMVDDKIHHATKKKILQKSERKRKKKFRREIFEDGNSQIVSPILQIFRQSCCFFGVAVIHWRPSIYKIYKTYTHTYIHIYTMG